MENLFSKQSTAGWVKFTINLKTEYVISERYSIWWYILNDASYIPYYPMYAFVEKYYKYILKQGIAGLQRRGL